MSEPKVTKEEMLEVLDQLKDWSAPYWEIKKQMIRSLIENMDKKVSREIWDKWTGRIKDDYNLGPMHIIYLMKEMLTELGLKIEGEE